MDNISLPPKRRSLLKTVLLALLGLVILTILGLVVWCLLPSPANQLAIAALASDETVNVSDSGWLEFSPRNPGAVSSGMNSLDENSTTLPDSENTESGYDAAMAEEKVGFILYPGVHVDYHAYAPLAREFAKAGYLSVIVSMPLNVPALNSDVALAVMKAYPSIKRWVVGGHSMGGTFAGEFVAHFGGPDGSLDTGKRLAGLVIWGSIALSDLSANATLPVLSIGADHDGNVPPETIQKNRSKLPANTRFETIKGGNHAQFGCYGDQFGDKPATISAEDQRRQVVAITLDFLNGLGTSQ